MGTVLTARDPGNGMLRKLTGVRAAPCDLGCLSLYRTEGSWRPLLPVAGLILAVLARVLPRRVMPCCSLIPAYRLLSC